MLQPLDTTDSSHIAAIASLWTAACGPDLAITERLVRYNTRPMHGVVQAGQMAIKNGQPIGFVLASAMPDNPSTTPPGAGWIDAIAVLPAFRRQGVGSALLAWAEGWLKSQSSTRIRLGGSLHPFTAGLPVELGSEPFFQARGYHGRPGSDQEWDVAADLGAYTTPPTRSAQARIVPAEPGQEEALLTFLRREFSTRWRYESEDFLREGGRISDYMLLWTEHGVDGFCVLTFEDSMRTVERFYMHRLPRPWGQLGPIGVSQGIQGKGYGGALLDAGLRRLRDSGIRGCVIDWTGLIDFYGKYGFTPYRQYAMLVKLLNTPT